MAKIIINLPGGLKIEREVADKSAPKSSCPAIPKADPMPETETATEVVEEAVKPKTRRGRPKKKPDAE